MFLSECYEYLKERWKDELVVTSAGSASNEWYRSTKSDRSFYLQASMGISPMFSLGLALGLPAARVWNFDGDGALVMNPGALLSEAEMQPKNMIHFICANRVYGAVNSHPFASNTQVDFVGLARSCGIKRTFRYESLDEFKAGIDGVLDTPDYAFVVLELEVQRNRPKSEVPFDGAELKYLFGRHIEERFGVQVFGKHG